MRRLGWLLLWVIAAPLPAQRPESALERKIAAIVADPKVAHDHWGVAVYGLDGKALAGLNEGQFFVPASNAKLFTTAAALAVLGDSATFETKVLGRGVWSGPPIATSLKGDAVLVGGGEANLSGRDLPYAGGHSETGSAPPLHYLEQMADAVAIGGLKTVSGDIVGDDTLFPWEPYPMDWAADDFVWGYGAPVSALTVNDNQIRMVVTPSAVGEPATVTVDPAVPYYTIVNTVITGSAKLGGSVQFDRALGSKLLRVFGTIAADSSPDAEEIAIQDPAEYAAIAFKTMLEARGIAVTGIARAQHRLSTDAKGFQTEAKEPIPGLRVRGPNEGNGLPRSSQWGCADCGGFAEKLLATHRSVPLGVDVTMTNKVSQNLHAELLLHQLGVQAGDSGSGAQGVRVLRAFLLRAGIPPTSSSFTTAPE